jgi:hypothetical protein
MQAVQRVPDNDVEEPVAGTAAVAFPGLVHDLSLIPVHPGSPVHVQAKLRVGRPGDSYEQEADRIGGQVIRMPGSQLHPLPSKHVHAGGAEEMAAPPMIHDVLAAPGRPLDPAARAFMEPCFGQDLSHVRVHADAGAARSAESIDARAYTVGHHVFFGPGEYRPGAADGRRLLAHELAHVAQQYDSGRLLSTVVQRDDKPTVKDPKARTGAKTVPAEQAEDPKVAALKAELVAMFGFSAVTDPTSAKWTVPQLEKMKRALARVPAVERVAIKGVELRRLHQTTEFGSTSSGLFKQQIAASSGIREDRIEIADDAFDNDVDFDAGQGHTFFGGQQVQGAPSEAVLTHEVGHAVESVAKRQAEEGRVKAELSDTAVFTGLASAIQAYNAAVLTSITVPPWGSAKEKNYQTAILNAQEKLSAISKNLATLPETPTAAQSKKGLAGVKGALAPARTAIAARNAARQALPRDSTYAMATEEAAQDSWMAAAVAMVAALEARSGAQAAAEKAQGTEDAAQITVKVSSGKQIRMTRRLAEFVAVIEANNIDIANSELGDHVTSHWPDSPEEAYAELYSLSVIAGQGLRKFDKKSAVATYFTSPVGLKGAQKTQIAAWLASHK